MYQNASLLALFGIAYVASNRKEQICSPFLFGYLDIYRRADEI